MSGLTLSLIVTLVLTLILALTLRAGEAKGTIELISLYLNMYSLQIEAYYIIAIKYIRAIGYYIF